MAIKELKAQDLHKGSLILINAKHAYIDSASTDTFVEVSPSLWLENNAAKMLKALMKALKAEEDILYVSGLRTRETQRALFDETLKSFGEAYTRAFVALPGHSEHETGLAIDLGKKRENVDFVCPEFPYEGICQSFRTLAPSYGFIQRYPKGKESETGIAHEPWHFRYVGLPHSEIISSMNLTLEAYHDYLKNFPYGQRFLNWESKGYAFKVAYMPWNPFETSVEVEDSKYIRIQGNNVDGFVYTEMV